MNEYIISACVGVGLIVGGVIGWLVSKVKANATMQANREEIETRLREKESELAALKSGSEVQLESLLSRIKEKEEALRKLEAVVQEKAEEASESNRKAEIARLSEQSAKVSLEEKQTEFSEVKRDRDIARSEWDKAREQLATERARNEALEEKLNVQKTEMEKMGERFNTEFENIANKILETKTEKFTELNKTHLTAILEPLGKNIVEFKTKVEEVYDKESKERFSLGEKVKELSELNQIISKEARDLTRALKGEAKTQGNWGEMILENILERSGLTKGREYFMEHQLTDEGGNALRSDSEGKKMRPDAVIAYPDNRRVIVDSKVSLNAYVRMVAAEDLNVQKEEAKSHAAAVRNHIIALSTKGYDDYDKSLDFVMMFIPSEPAYIAALQEDGDLWAFAYDKRILLLSPTNLITSLKLIADLWKREYQNQNALDIADRGAKLYDKFVGFVENMKGVSDLLDKARNKQEEAYKQLSTGRDNLVLQATKLKELGLKAKKSLPSDIVSASGVEVPILEGRDESEKG